MDQTRFDAAAKALSAATTRRRGLGAAVAVLLGARVAPEIAEAKRVQTEGFGPSPEPTKRPCGDGSKKANQCRTNGDCCTGLCEKQTQQRHRKNKKHGNRHWKSGRCYCIASGEACAVDANCCSGICLDGVCGPVPACYFGNCDGCCDGDECITQEQDEQQCGVHGEICMVCDGATTLCCDGVCSVPYWNINVDSPASQSFSSTKGIAVSSDGLHLYIVSSDLGTVLEFVRPDVGSNWVEYSSFGALGNSPWNFTSPNGIAVSADGLTAYVVDTGANEVKIWSRNSIASTSWVWQTDVTHNTLNQPMNCAVSQNQLVMLVTNYATNMVTSFTRANTSVPFSFYSTEGSGNGFGYSGIAGSEDELTVYITNVVTSVVEVWVWGEGLATSFGRVGTGWGELAGPIDVDVSADNLTVYVSDYGNQRVSIWSRPSVLSNSWHNQSVAGTFGDPWGVAVMPDSSELWITAAMSGCEQYDAGCEFIPLP